MKLLLERWERYLKEVRTLIVHRRSDLVKYITDFPEQKIHLDNPKGSFKSFDRDQENKLELPFDYGEYSDIINPADDMGWDIIIVPSATRADLDLIPVGHIAYSESRPKKVGNDKIIIAPAADYSSEDAEIIEEFFGPLDGFDPIEWY